MGSRFWFLLFSILVAWSEAKHRLKKQVNESENDLEKHKELVLSIQEVNKTQFFEQDTDKGEYQFGYQISPDGNFHHENRAPDGVTYGCYGYVDAYGTPVEYYYISDGWGYRTVMPNAPVEIFYQAHDPNAHVQGDVEENQVDGNENGENHSHHHEHHKHHGEIVPWNQLQFPKQCENKDFTLPPPQAGVSAFPSQPSQNVVSGRPIGQPYPTRPSRPGTTNGAGFGKPQSSTAKPQKPTYTRPTGQITGEAGFPVRPQTQLPGQTSTEYQEKETTRPGTSVTEYPLKPNVSGQLPSSEAGVFPESSSTQISSRPTVTYPESSLTPGRPDTKPKPGLPEQSSTEFPDKLIPDQPSVPGSPSQLQPGISERPSSVQPSRPGISEVGIQEKPKPEFSGLFPIDYPGHTPRPTLPETSGNEYSQEPQTELQGVPTGYPGQSSKPETPASSGKPLPEFSGSISGSRPGQPSRPFEAQPGLLPTGYPEQPLQPSKPFKPSKPTSVTGYPEKPQPEFQGSVSTDYPGQSPQPAQPLGPGLSGFPERPNKPSETGVVGAEYPQEPPTGHPGELLTGHPGQPSRPGTSVSSGKPLPEFPGSISGGSPGQSSRPTEPIRPGYPGQPSLPSDLGISGTGYTEKPQTEPSGKFPTGHPTQSSKPDTSGTTGFSGKPELGYPSKLPTDFPGQSPKPTQPSQPSFPIRPSQPSGSGTSGTGYPGKPQTTRPGELHTGLPGQHTGPEYSERPELGISGTQPTQPDATGIGYPEKPQPELSSNFSEIPAQPTGYPQQPIKPGFSGTEYPEESQTGVSTGLPGQFFGFPSQPTKPSKPEASVTGYPSKPGFEIPGIFPADSSQTSKPGNLVPEQTELPELSEGLSMKFPGQSSQSTQSSITGSPTSGYSEKPDSEISSQAASGVFQRPTETSESGFPELPGTSQSGSRPTYPGQTLESVKPGQSFTNYPEKPQPGSPGQRPNTYPGQPTRPSGLGGLEAGYPQRPQTGEIPSGFPGQPSQPYRPSASVTSYPGEPQPVIPDSSPTTYPERPTGDPGYLVKPSSPGISEMGYSEKPQPGLPEKFPTSYPGQLSKPDISESLGKPKPGISSSHPTGFPGQSPQPIQPAQPGFPGQPMQPIGLGTGTGYPEKPQTELPGEFSVVYPTQPSTSSISETGSPEKPQPGLPSDFSQFPMRPEGYPQRPTKPSKPGLPETEYPEEIPAEYSEHPPGPSTPGYPGTSQPGIYSTHQASFPGQSLQPIQPTQPGFTGQQSQSSGSGSFGTRYPIAPQTELPGEFSMGYPNQPSRPDAAGIDYEEKPQPGYPLGLTEFPTRPTGYPQQPTKPSKPDSSETGYPGELPIGSPSQPSQPSGSGTSAYPDTAKPEFSVSFPTDYTEQLSSSSPGRPNRPSELGISETENPQKPQSELPGQRPTSYPEQPTQPSKPQSLFPTDFPGQPSGSGGPGVGYPQRPQTELANELSTKFPGQSSYSPRPNTTSYPSKPQPGQISTIYPKQPLPTIPSEYPEKPYEPGTSVAEYPEKPESGFSSSLSNKYPVQPQQPGQSSANETNTEIPQTGFPGSSTIGYPLQPNEFPHNFGMAYPGKPESESAAQPSPQYPEQFPIPDTTGAGYPQKPQAGTVGPGTGFPIQVKPSEPSEPDIGSKYPQSPGFGANEQLSTAYPSMPITSPSPGVSGTHAPHLPVGPGVSLPSSQKPFEPDYPTVGYFPSPSPSSPSHPSPSASFKPSSQGMTTVVETSEISKYPGQKPAFGIEESTSTPNFVEDKLTNCGGFQQLPCATTEKEIDSFTFMGPGSSPVSTSCLCDPKDVKCMLDCVNADRQTSQKPFGGLPEVTTFKPTRPEKPTDLFCNCSPFDSECIKICMEAKECDGSQGDCSISEGSPGQPDYPTYPPPACGGPGQEDCPYPPAGIKPFPEFTYPTPLGSTPNGNNIKTPSEFPECQNKESEACNRPTNSFEISSTKPFTPSKVTTGTDKITTYPSNSQSASFPPFISKEPEFPTDFNQPFTESEFGMSITGKPSQGFSPVQKPGNGNLPSEPEREPSKPIQPTDSEKIPGEPVQPLGPEGPYQTTEKPYYPINPEYPGEPSSPDQTSQTGYEGQQPIDLELMIPVKPLEPTGSEKEPQVPGQSYKPTGIGGGDFGKPVVPQGASKPEEENLGNITPETGGAQPGPDQEFPDLGERPVHFGQGASKPGKPGLPASSSKPDYGFSSTSQTETPEMIHFKPSQMPQVPGGILPSQSSGGEPTDSFLIPESLGTSKPQNTSKYPEGIISSTPSILGCDLSLSHCTPGGAPPIYIIPYPVPIVPSPGSCPCYLVSPKNETSDVSTPRPSLPSSTQSPYPENFLPQGIIGYIPVVFYPYCPGNNTNSDMVQPYFPQAYPVPYPCQQCQNENNSQFTLKSSLIPQSIPSRPTRFTSSYLYSPVANGVPNFVQEAKFLKGNSFRTQRKSRRRILHKQESRNTNSFQQVLEQGNIKSEQIVKSPHRSSQFGKRIRPIVRY